MATSRKTLFVARFGILLALEALVCFTILGSIPIGPMVATLMMVPVIVTAIVMGPGAGTAMGSFAGLFSLIVWTFTPPLAPIAFAFSPFYGVGDASGSALSLIVVFVPRILGGLLAGLSFRALAGYCTRTGKKKAVAYGLAGLVGSMTNTIGVLGCIYLLFGGAYASALGMAYDVLLATIGTVVLTNGIPEAVLCTVIAGAVCQPIRLVMGGSRS